MDIKSDDIGVGMGMSSSSIQGSTGALGLGMGVLGLLGSLSEGNQAANISSQEYQLSSQNAGYEMQISALRQRQMNLFGQRQQMENFRNVQKAKAQGMATAVQSGSQYGSGIQGAQAEETATGARNTMQIGQDLEIGNNIFGLTGKIDQNKITQAQLQSQMASLQGNQSIFQGLGQLGMGLMQSAGPLGLMLGV